MTRTLDRLAPRCQWLVLGPAGPEAVPGPARRTFSGEGLQSLARGRRPCLKAPAARAPAAERSVPAPKPRLDHCGCLPDSDSVTAVSGVTAVTGPQWLQARRLGERVRVAFRVGELVTTAVTVSGELVTTAAAGAVARARPGRTRNPVISESPSTSLTVPWWRRMRLARRRPRTRTRTRIAEHRCLPVVLVTPRLWPSRHATRTSDLT